MNVKSSRLFINKKKNAPPTPKQVFDHKLRERMQTLRITVEEKSLEIKKLQKQARALMDYHLRIKSNLKSRERALTTFESDK